MNPPKKKREGPDKQNLPRSKPDQHDADERADLREALLKHWVFVISVLGSAAAIISTGTWAVFDFFSSQRISQLSESHNQSIASTNSQYIALIAKEQSEHQNVQNKLNFTIERLRTELNSANNTVQFAIGDGIISYLQKTNFLVSMLDARSILTNASLTKFELAIFPNLETRGWQLHSGIRLKQVLKFVNSDLLVLPRDNPDDEESALWWWKCHAYTYQLSSNSAMLSFCAQLPGSQAKIAYSNAVTRSEDTLSSDPIVYATSRTLNELSIELEHITITKAQLVDGLASVQGLVHSSELHNFFIILGFEQNDVLYLFGISGPTQPTLDNALAELGNWIGSIRVATRHPGLDYLTVETKTTKTTNFLDKANERLRQ